MLHIRDTSFPEITIPLPNGIAVLMGDSASGKSYIVKMLSTLKRSPSSLISTSIPLDRILIVNDISTLLLDGTIRDVQNKLIVIDRFDLWACDELFQFINTSDNMFLLCAHLLYDELQVAFSSFQVLRYDDVNRVFTTEPYFNSTECIPTLLKQ